MIEAENRAAVVETTFHTWLPDLSAPWETYDLPAPGDDYRSGIWAYAVGRPACEHPRYEDACEMAEAAGWLQWWIRSYADVEATLEGCWFDVEAAVRTCNFLEMLVLSKGKWANHTLRLLDWQRYDFIMPLYGWKAPDNWRRFTKGGLWIPKKNGKSGLSSGLGLYHLRADKEHTPYVWAAACDRKQAGLIHDESVRMLKRTPGLPDDLKPIDSRKRITFPARSGCFEALSADAELQEGLDWSAGFIDELHVGVRKMWSTLSGGGAARDQPMLISLSTAGIYDSESIGWEQWERGMKIRDGSLVDSSFFSLMYYAEQGDDWEDWAVIRRANPSFGEICRERYFKERMQEARETPAKQSDFLRYNLNIWVHAAVRAFPIRVWANCGADGDSCEEILERWAHEMEGATCYGGLDLSLTKDLTAHVLWFKPDEARGWNKHRIVPHFWLPVANISELEKANNAPYRDWAKRGLMTLTEGNSIDHRAARDRVFADSQTYDLREVGFDRRCSIEIVRDLTDLGVNMVEVPQSFNVMGPATQDFERLMLREMIEHPNHPIFTWMMSNCQYEYSRDGIPKIRKGDGLTRFKVDGPVAAVIAASRALANAEFAQMAPDVFVFNRPGDADESEGATTMDAIGSLTRALDEYRGTRYSIAMSAETRESLGAPECIAGLVVEVQTIPEGTIHIMDGPVFVGRIPIGSNKNEQGDSAMEAAGS